MRTSLPPATAIVATELAKLESLLESRLSSDDPWLESLGRYAFRLGGKRLRPVLLFLAVRLFAHEITPRQLDFAAALELIHTATLIHDDIIDGATMRRHLATMNSRWDAATSVLAGDFLFSEAMRLVTAHSDATGNQIIAEALSLTCRGELRQRGMAGRLDVTRSEYLTLIGEKTAALLASACQLGGYLAGASNAATESLRQFGFSLGLAFQIADDVLDVTGDEARMGKTLGTDLAQRKMTLPLILLWEQGDAAMRERLQRFFAQDSLSAEDQQALRTLACESGTTQQALAVAAHLAAEATNALNSAALSNAALSGSAAAPRDALVSLARFIVQRDV